MKKYHYYFIVGLLLFMIGGVISSISEIETTEFRHSVDEEFITYEKTVYPYEIWGRLIELMGVAFIGGSIFIWHEYTKSSERLKKLNKFTCTKCHTPSEIDSPYCPYCGKKRE